MGRRNVSSETFLNFTCHSVNSKPENVNDNGDWPSFYCKNERDVNLMPSSNVLIDSMHIETQERVEFTLSKDAPLKIVLFKYDQVECTLSLLF